MLKLKLYMEDESGQRVLVEPYETNVFNNFMSPPNNIEERIVTAKDQLVRLNKCSVPPEGWRCTRYKGHSGPCAAVPVEKTDASIAKNLMSEFDVLTKLLGYSEEEANQIVARKKIETLEQLKLKIMTENPGLIGIPPNIDEYK